MTERRNNPAFWVMIGIPAFAIVASALLIAEALRSAEPELPASYAVEGDALEADFAAAEIAHRAGVVLRLEFIDGNHVRVRAEARDTHTLPPALELRFTHATLPKLDRHAVIRRTAPNTYEGELAALERGRWLLQIDARPDEGPSWKLRQRLHAPFDIVTLGR